MYVPLLARIAEVYASKKFFTLDRAVGHFIYDKAIEGLTRERVLEIINNLPDLVKEIQEDSYGPCEVCNELAKLDDIERAALVAPFLGELGMDDYRIDDSVGTQIDSLHLNLLAAHRECMGASGGEAGCQSVKRMAKKLAELVLPIIAHVLNLKVEDSLEPAPKPSRKPRVQAVQAVSAAPSNVTASSQLSDDTSFKTRIRVYPHDITKLYLPERALMEFVVLELYRTLVATKHDEYGRDRYKTAYITDGDELELKYVATTVPAFLAEMLEAIERDSEVEKYFANSVSVYVYHGGRSRHRAVVEFDEERYGAVASILAHDAVTGRLDLVKAFRNALATVLARLPFINVGGREIPTLELLAESDGLKRLVTEYARMKGRDEEEEAAVGAELVRSLLVELNAFKATFKEIKDKFGAVSKAVKGVSKRILRRFGRALGLVDRIERVVRKTREMGVWRTRGFKKSRRSVGAYERAVKPLGVYHAKADALYIISALLYNAETLNLEGRDDAVMEELRLSVKDAYRDLVDRIRNMFLLNGPVSEDERRNSNSIDDLLTDLPFKAEESWFASLQSTIYGHAVRVDEVDRLQFTDLTKLERNVNFAVTVPTALAFISNAMRKQVMPKYSDLPLRRSVTVSMNGYWLRYFLMKIPQEDVMPSDEVQFVSYRPEEWNEAVKWFLDEFMKYPPRELRLRRLSRNVLEAIEEAAGYFGKYAEPFLKKLKEWLGVRK